MPDDPKGTTGNPPADGSAATTGNPPADSTTVTTSGDWRDALDPALKGEKSLSAIKDIPSLAKGYVEAQKLVGGSIRLPNDKMKPEEAAKVMDDIYTKLGRPESAEKYGLNPEPIAPFLREGEMDSFKKTAFELGLNGKQAQALIDWQAKNISTAMAAMKEAAVKTEADLRGEWGAAFDRNVGLAARAITEVGGKDVLEYLDKTGLGNHPGLLKMFVKIGGILADEGYIDGDIDGATGPSEAREEIASILRDKSHPYWKGDKEAVEHMANLHQLAYPEA